MAEVELIPKLGSIICVRYDVVVLTNEDRGFIDFVYVYCDVTAYMLSLLVKTTTLFQTHMYVG